MSELAHRKELLQAKIEAQRTILGLEIRAARASFDPVGAALRLVGVDRSAAEIVVPLLHAVTAHLMNAEEPAQDASTDESERPDC